MLRLNAIIFVALMTCAPGLALSQDRPAMEPHRNDSETASTDAASTLFNAMNVTLGQMYEGLGLAALDAVPPVTLEVFAAAIPKADQPEDIGELKVYFDAASQDLRKAEPDSWRDYAVVNTADGCGPNSDNDRTVAFRPLNFDGVRGHQCVTIQQDAQGLWKLQSRSVAVGQTASVRLNYVTEIMIVDRPGRSREVGAETYAAIMTVGDRLARHTAVVASIGVPASRDTPEAVAALVLDYQRKMTGVLPDGEWTTTLPDVDQPD